MDKEQQMKQKEAFKALSVGGKIQYIWNYYRAHIIVGAIIIAFVGYLIYHYATFKDTVLDILMVNSDLQYENLEDDGLGEFKGLIGFDEKKQDIILDKSLAYSDNQEQANIYDVQATTIKMSVDGNDVCFSDEYAFNAYAKDGAFLDLREYLTEDEMASIQDNIAYATDEVTGEKVPCGIHLVDHPWLQKTSYYQNDAYVGIMINNDDLDTATAFIRYLLGM